MCQSLENLSKHLLWNCSPEFKSKVFATVCFKDVVRKKHHSLLEEKTQWKYCLYVSLYMTSMYYHEIFFSVCIFLVCQFRKGGLTPFHKSTWLIWVHMASVLTTGCRALFNSELRMWYNRDAILQWKHDWTRIYFALQLSVPLLGPSLHAILRWLGHVCTK